MRFFRRFSFLHRRTKSDTAALLTVVPKANAVVRSHSVEELGALGRVDARPYYRYDVLRATIPASMEPDHTPSRNFDLFTSERRIKTLEARVEGLTRANHKLDLDCRQLQEQAMEYKSERYITLRNGAAARREARAAKADLVKLEAKLAHYERFLGLLIGIGLHELVLVKAQAALRNGLSADEALVDAIKEAAAKPGSAWADIMPAIVGTRSPEQYVAAINLTLRLRKELKDVRKVAKFWRRAAKEDPRNVNLITPSISLLSDVNDPLPEERQRAVDDLMKTRLCHNGAGSASVTSKPQMLSPLVMSLRPAPTIHNLLVISEDSNVAQEKISVPPSNSSVAVQKAPSAGFILPPLASESFRQELASRASAESLFGQSSSKSSGRRVLGEVDMNARPSSGLFPKSESLTSQGSKLSAEAPGKGRALVITQSVDSISASLHSENRANDLVPTPSNSVNDFFTSTLTKSLIKLRATIPADDVGVPHRQRPESMESVPFDNSAFNPLLTASGGFHEAEDARNSANTSIMAGSNESFASQTVNGDSEAGCHPMAIPAEENPPRTLGMIVEESQGSLDTTCALGDTSLESSEDTTLNDRDISSNEAIASIEPTVPEKDEENTTDLSPGKTSRLPVLKQLRRMSPTTSTVTKIMNLKPTKPLMIRKKKEANNTSSIPTPVKFPSINDALAPANRRLVGLRRRVENVVPRERHYNSAK